MAGLDRYAEHFAGASKAWNVDPRLLRAVAMAESGGDENTPDSRAGAAGLMQIMPETAKGMGVNPYVPQQAIYAAAKLLDENLRRYGNVPDALRAYNAGTDRTRWNNPETQSYVSRVASYFPARQDAPAPRRTETGAMSQQNRQRPSDDALMASLTAGSPSQQASANQGSRTSGGRPDDDAMMRMLTGGAATPLPTRAHAHQGSWVGNLAQFGADAVDAAGRELSKPIIFAESHIPGVAKALKGTGYAPDEWRDLNKFREQEQAGDWGAGASRLGGALLGDSLVAGGVSKLLPAAKGGMLALAGRRAAEGAATAELTDQNPLLGGVIGAGSVPVGALASKVGGKLVRRGGNALDPDGVATRGAEPQPADMAAASEAHGSPPENSAASPSGDTQVPPEAIRLGLFTSPKDAEKLAGRIWDDAQKGGPVSLIQSKIPGVHLTASQATGNSGLALIERNRRAANPNLFTALEQANAEARNAYAQKVIGTEDQL
ncbi:lytic transglycosylase domain-containing protein, partial [Acetobacter sacchari]